MPPDVSAAPAEVAFDADGRPSVRPVAGIPPRPMVSGPEEARRQAGQGPLRRGHPDGGLVAPGVAGPEGPGASRRSRPTRPSCSSCRPPRCPPSSPRCSASVTTGRASARSPPTAEGERVLLKVIGPPYYTLLRAIDKSARQGATVPLTWSGPRGCGSSSGHDHPLAAQIRPADGQVLLHRAAPRVGRTSRTAPFQDVYDILDFKLPAAAVEWQRVAAQGQDAVPLRLAAGNAADVAEMWVLTEDAVDQLDALVRDADDRLMARLCSPSPPTRTGRRRSSSRPGRRSCRHRSCRWERPIGFKPYWKLPNLFLPVGRRLMPTLRRDAVRKLLADDPDQVVWLMPQAGRQVHPGGAAGRRLPPARRLGRLRHRPRARRSSRRGSQATHFDFDSFVCKDDQAGQAQAAAGRQGRRSRRRATATATPTRPTSRPRPRAKPGRRRPRPAGRRDRLPGPGRDRPAERVEGPPARAGGPIQGRSTARSTTRSGVALWPQLARLNAGPQRQVRGGHLLDERLLGAARGAPADGSWGWLHGEDPTPARCRRPTSGTRPWRSGCRRPETVRGVRRPRRPRLPAEPGPGVARQPRCRRSASTWRSTRASCGVRAVWLAWVAPGRGRRRGATTSWPWPASATGSCSACWPRD